MKTWRLVREDVLGMTDYEWNRETQREHHLTKAQVKALESGQVVETKRAGGTQFYLLEEPETAVCPTCGGSGRIHLHKNRGIA